VGREFTDVFYADFALVVELDGRLHLTPTHRRRDLSRDNRATLRSESTLRYGWSDITSRPCAAALQVLQVLRRTEPALAGRGCSPSCPVGSPLREIGVG
jgi:very-short-patch-repair endonuclease